MLDKKLSSIGSITINAEGIQITGFEAEQATCREVAILAELWASAELLADANKAILEPGGGLASVDEGCQWELESAIHGLYWITGCDAHYRIDEDSDPEREREGIRFCFNCGKPVEVFW